MAWTAPTDRTTGYVVTAADWNIVEDDLTFLSGSAGAVVATSETTASTTYTDLATSGPAVTVTTGTKAIVIVSCWGSNNTGTDGAAMSFAVSGATTLAAADNGSGLVGNGAVVQSATGVAVITGLTAGSNTFTAKYRVSVGGTATFLRRNITVIPLP